MAKNGTTLPRAYKELCSDVYCRWYTGDDGGLDTDSILFAYELMGKSKFLRSVFYDRDEIPGPAEFLNFLTQERFTLFMLYERTGIPIAMCWLEACLFTGNQRFGHFTTFNVCPERRMWVEGGRALCRFVRDAMGLRQLIGLTPACYRHAVQAAKELGYKPVATLEKAVWCLGKQRDAILSINNLSEL